MGKSINCNSFRGKFDDFLRVDTEVLDNLATGLRETCPEERRCQHIARNHLVREILRIIPTVLVNTNPAPWNLAMVLKRIPRTNRNHATLLISTAVDKNPEISLRLRMNPIGITEETLTTAPKKRRDPQTKDSLCGSEDKVHYFTVMSYL